MLIEREQQKAMRKFQLETKCTTEESKFYVEQSEYDANKAIAKYKEDLEWETKNSPLVKVQ